MEKEITIDFNSLIRYFKKNILRILLINLMFSILLTVGLIFLGNKKYESNSKNKQKLLALREESNQSKAKGEIKNIGGSLYYYENDKAVPKGLLYLDGNYYFAGDDGKLTVNRSQFLTKTHGILEKRVYEFNKNGKIIDIKKDKDVLIDIEKESKIPVKKGLKSHILTFIISFIILFIFTTVAFLLNRVLSLKITNINELESILKIPVFTTGINRNGKEKEFEELANEIKLLLGDKSNEKLLIYSSKDSKLSIKLKELFKNTDLKIINNKEKDIEQLTKILNSTQALLLIDESNNKIKELLSLKEVLIENHVKILGAVLY